MNFFFLLYFKNIPLGRCVRIYSFFRVFILHSSNLRHQFSVSFSKWNVALFSLSNLDSVDLLITILLPFRFRSIFDKEEEEGRKKKQKERFLSIIECDTHSAHIDTVKKKYELNGNSRRDSKTCIQENKQQ